MLVTWVWRILRLERGRKKTKRKRRKRRKRRTKRKKSIKRNGKMRLGLTRAEAHNLLPNSLLVRIKAQGLNHLQARYPIGLIYRSIPPRLHLRLIFLPFLCPCHQLYHPSYLTKIISQICMVYHLCLSNLNSCSHQALSPIPLSHLKTIYSNQRTRPPCTRCCYPGIWLDSTLVCTREELKQTGREEKTRISSV